MPLSCAEAGSDGKFSWFAVKGILYRWSFSEVPEDAWLPTLESITVDSLRFLGDNNRCVFQKLLSACPVLKELTINGMAWETWIWSGNISSESVERLCIQRVFPVVVAGFDSHDQRIVFNTPKLSQLHYADLVAHDYQANFGALKDVTLKLQFVFNQP